MIGRKSKLSTLTSRRQPPMPHSDEPCRALPHIKSVENGPETKLIMQNASCELRDRLLQNAIRMIANAILSLFL